MSEQRVKGTPSAGGRLDCLGCALCEFRDDWIIKNDTYYEQVAG